MGDVIAAFTSGLKKWNCSRVDAKKYKRSLRNLSKVKVLSITITRDQIGIGRFCRGCGIKALYRWSQSSIVAKKVLLNLTLSRLPFAMYLHK